MALLIGNGYARYSRRHVSMEGRPMSSFCLGAFIRAMRQAVPNARTAPPV